MPCPGARIGDAGAPNKGISARLINEGLSRAANDGWHGVFVLSEPEYYQRFGFDGATAEGFETSYPRAYFMALELQPDGLKGRGGPVVYASAFLAL